MVGFASLILAYLWISSFYPIIDIDRWADFGTVAFGWLLAGFSPLSLVYSVFGVFNSGLAVLCIIIGPPRNKHVGKDVKKGGNGFIGQLIRRAAYNRVSCGPSRKRLQ